MKKGKKKKKLYSGHKAEVMRDEGNWWGEGERGAKHAGELGCVPGKGALKEECSFYRDANLENFTGIILGLSHWDAQKTVLWDGSLPAVPCGSFGTEVSGREQPSAQGFQKNHCFHQIKVQKKIVS